MKRYVPLLVALFGMLILQPIGVSLFSTNVPLNFLITEPITPLARQLAVIEAIMGQLYIAVVIARIVALGTAEAMKGPTAE